MAKEDLDELEQEDDQDGAEDGDESESGEGGGSGKKKLILILLALLLLGGGGGGAYWYFMMPHGDEKPERKPPTYIRLDPMVVNVNSESESHFLQVTIDLKVEDEKVTEEVKLLMPEIRDGALLLFSGQDPFEVVTPQKREQLRKAILDLANKAVSEHMHDEHKKSPIKGVYFTTFVLQ